MLIHSFGIFQDSAYPTVNVEIDVRSANKPMSFVDSASRRNGKIDNLVFCNSLQ